jgi:propionyl-CoA synthetase
MINRKSISNSYHLLKNLNRFSQKFPSLNHFYSTKSNETKKNYQDQYNKSIKNREEYWFEKTNLIEWFNKPKQCLDATKSPFDKWFDDGETNAAYNCLDVHVNNGFGDELALIHDSPVTGIKKTYTYKQLLDEVSLFAGVLSKHGIKKGDVVLIYMPMIPQAIVSMLATVRLGAIHSLVFGGFASKELATRINHAKPKIIVSANSGVEPGRIINYKQLLDDAIAISDHKPNKCIFYNREMFPKVTVDVNGHLYLDYDNELKSTRPHDCVPVGSNFPLYLLYTSGTTGLPKVTN